MDTVRNSLASWLSPVVIRLLLIVTSAKWCSVILLIFTRLDRQPHDGWKSNFQVLTEFKPLIGFCRGLNIPLTYCFPLTSHRPGLTVWPGNRIQDFMLSSSACDHWNCDLRTSVMTRLKCEFLNLFEHVNKLSWIWTSAIWRQQWRTNILLTNRMVQRRSMMTSANSFAENNLINMINGLRSW